MTYEFPVNPADLYGERRPQFVNRGLPSADLDQVVSRVTQMWADATYDVDVPDNFDANRYGPAGTIRRRREQAVWCPRAR